MHTIGLTAHRHPNFYDEHGQLVFRAEETLYRINAHQFTFLSGVIGGMVALAGPVDGDGLSDVKPIRLSETANEVDALFGWMTRIGPPLKTVEAWIAILKLATKYVIRLARDEAIEKLDSFHMPAGRRLSLGLAFSVPQWVQPAIRDLVLAPVGGDTSHDLALVRSDVLAKITCLRERVILHRANLLNKSEAIHHDLELCSGSQCGSLSWEMAWPSIMRLLFRPLNRNGVWWSGLRIYSVLEKTQFSDLTEACKQATLQSMVARNVLGKENDLVTEGIIEIVEYCDVFTPPEFQDQVENAISSLTEQ